MRQNKGFSLVELMIVVAIIGILAAIAIPNFVAMQSKSKRAEVPGNVDAIKTAELAYDAGFDGFIATAVQPRASTSLNKTQKTWTHSDTNSWGQLGWRPDGPVRGNYTVALTGTTDFVVTGKCDVDDDSQIATYTSTKLTNTTLAAADNGVY
jgi:type IV pilus assembly protein PilA